MKLSLKRFVKDGRGAVLVETALVLPLLLLLLAASAELGRFIYTYNTLAKATRASARYLSNKCLSDSRISSAKNLAAYGTTTTGTSILPNLSAGNVVVCSGAPERNEACTPPPSNTTPEMITVRIDDYTYQLIIPVGPLADLASFEIAPSTTIKYFVTAPIVGGCS